jgi:hypothetical protein
MACQEEVVANTITTCYTQPNNPRHGGGLARRAVGYNPPPCLGHVARVRSPFTCACTCTPTCLCLVGPSLASCAWLVVLVGRGAGLGVGVCMFKGTTPPPHFSNRSFLGTITGDLPRHRLKLIKTASGPKMDPTGSPK